MSYEKLTSRLCSGGRGDNSMIRGAKCPLPPLKEALLGGHSPHGKTATVHNTKCNIQRMEIPTFTNLFPRSLCHFFRQGDRLLADQLLSLVQQLAAQQFILLLQRLHFLRDNSVENIGMLSEVHILYKSLQLLKVSFCIANHTNLSAVLKIIARAMY